MMQDYNALTDEQLVARLTGSDEAAFRMLYDRYWQRMLVKAYTRLGSHADAEEVVQDAFINLWKRRARLSLRHSFHTYIAAVVRYEVMARVALNKHGRHAALEDQHLESLSDDATRQWLAFDDLAEEIEKAVQALPEKCRLVFRLSREEGLSEKQIAGKLAIAPKTVEAHMTKALKSLRTALNHLLFSALL
jgi:RNA polymerase sigma-70 factor (family 1)